MFTARPNALRSAVAIAVSSFILPSAEAVDKVEVKVPGYDHTRGKVHERHMTFHLNEGELPSGRISFVDKESAEYKNAFFSNQLKDSDFELSIQTEDEDNAAYVSTLKYKDHDVIALGHDLAKGSVTLLVNHVVYKFPDSVRKRLEEVKKVPEPKHGSKASDAKTALLNSLTEASTPSAFGHMLEALKKYANERSDKWLKTTTLYNIGTFNVPPIDVDNLSSLKFLQSELKDLTDIDPATMLQEHALIFPDPEQALSVMATALSLSISNPKAHRNKEVIQKLFDARRPVNFVTTQLTSEDTLSQLPKEDYPVITFGGKPGELVLNLGQISPAALIWIEEVTTGISSGYSSLKISYDNVPELLEACYHQQARILWRAAANEVDFNEGDITQLRHYQQLISLLDFVAIEKKDIVFDKAMLETTHLIGGGIDLRAFLVKRFAGVEGLKDVVLSSKLREKLESSGQDCCEVVKSTTADNTYNRLLRHHASSSKKVLQELQGIASDVPDLQGEEIEKYTQKIAELSQQLDDYDLPKTLDRRLTHRHFAEFPETAREDYQKLSEVAKKYSTVLPGKLKARLKVVLELAEHLNGQEPETKIDDLLKKYDFIGEFIDLSGNLKCSEDLFASHIKNLKFDPDKDADVIRKVVHSIPGKDMKNLYQDALKLKGVDLGQFTDHTIAIAQTDTTFDTAIRIKRLADKAPEQFLNSEEIADIRNWLAKMASPIDLPGEGALQLLDQDEQVLTTGTYGQLRVLSLLLSKKGYLSSEKLAYKLSAIKKLVSELDSETDLGLLLNDLSKSHGKLVKTIWNPETQLWKEEGQLPDFDVELDGIPHANKYRTACFGIIKELTFEEIQKLSEKHWTLEHLYSQKLLTPEAIRLGEFELSTLEKIKRARLVIPDDVSKTLTRLEDIGKKFNSLNKSTIQLMRRVASQNVLPTEEQLMALPVSTDIASPDTVKALRTFIEATVPETTPAELLDIIHSTRVIAGLCPPGTPPSSVFSKIEDHWDNLIGNLGVTKHPDKREAFKTSLVSAGFESPTDEIAFWVSEFILLAANKEKLAKYGSAFIELQNSLDEVNLDKITEGQILQAQLNLDSEDISSSRKLMATYSQDYQTLVESSKSATQEFGTLKKQLKDVINQFETTETELTKMSLENDNKQQKIDALNKEQTTYEANNRELKKACAYEQDLKNMLFREVKDLKLKLTAKDEHYDRLKKAIEKTQAKLETVKERNKYFALESENQEAVESLPDSYSSDQMKKSDDWLIQVDHPIPSREDLEGFPAPEVVDSITPNELEVLRLILLRHNVPPEEFGGLIHKLKLTQDWLSVSDGIVEINGQQFAKIKDIIKDPSKGSIQEIAIELHAEDNGVALQAMIDAMTDLNELRAIQRDVEIVVDMLVGQKITPQTLRMAYHGATPETVKLAREAVANNPVYYDQRFVELENQATLRIMKTLSQEMLAGDDNVKTLEVMGDPNSELYKAVKAIPASLSAGSQKDIRSIYHRLTLVADLINGDTAENSAILGNLVNALKQARELIDSDGKVIYPDSYHETLEAHGLNAYKSKITPILASGLTEKTLPVYFKHAGAIKQHYGNMVPESVLEAAYQPDWDAKQFGRVLTHAAIPEFWEPAKTAHIEPEIKELAAQIKILEEDYAQFNQLVSGMQPLEKAKLKLYNDFTELKAKLGDVSLKKLPPDHELVTVAGKISLANNFQELRSATKEFYNHPKVRSASSITVRLNKIRALLPHLATVEELKAMEQFDPGDIIGSARKWVDKVGDGIRSDILLPLLDPLLIMDENPTVDDIFPELALILGAQEAASNAPLEDASAPPGKSEIIMVADAQEQLDKLYQLQQKQIFDEGDLKTTRDLAAALEDEKYVRHLQLWAGSDSVTTLRDGLKLLQEATDEQQAKASLNAVFKQKDTIESLELNADLATVVKGVRKAAPDIKTYNRVSAQLTEPDIETYNKANAQLGTFGTYAGALENAVDQIANCITDNKDHLAPELVKAAPHPWNGGDIPDLSASLESANNMLKVVQEVEALEELHDISKRITQLDPPWMGNTGRKDLDPDFTRQRKKVINELDSFCIECRSGKFLPKGTLNRLHDKGVINQKVLKEAEQEFSDEIKVRKAASTLLKKMRQDETLSFSEALVSHTKLLSVLFDTADAAIPEDFMSVLKLIRGMYADDPNIINTLQEMREKSALVLGDIPEPIREQYAHTPQWQLLSQFISGEGTVGELGEDILIQEIIRSDSATRLKLHQKIAANMAKGKQADIQLSKSIEILTGLGDDSEKSAALFIKKAMTETSFTMEENPASPETLVKNLKQHYQSSLPDSEILVMANIIYRGLNKTPDSWGHVKSALDKMPQSGPKLFSGAIKQMMNMNQQMASALLGVNDAFHRWLARSPLIVKIVSAVHHYQLKVEDIEAIRTYQQLAMEEQFNPSAFKAAGKEVPNYPKAANLLQLSEEDLKSLAELPLERWKDSVINIASDPAKYQASYAVAQTFRNVGDLSLRFGLEFIADDILFYGGTGTIAIALGYADSTLEKFGLDRDSFLRILVKGYTDDLFNPYFQQKVARWVTPVLATHQVKRVINDFHIYINPADAPAASAALRSIAFFVLAEFNDLVWGGVLTKRMALAFRGLDQLVNIQLLLDDRIKRTRNKYARKKISNLEAHHSILQDLESIKLLNKAGDHWQEDCKKVLETLRGDDGITDEDIEYYRQYIDSSYSYQNIKKTWEESVATVSTILSKGRPFITPLTSSLPKYMILAGVADPMIRYGLNAAAPGMIGSLPAKLFATPLNVGSVTLPPTVVGTMAVMGATTAYDGMYNDFETTRQTWHPFAEFVDTWLYGIDFQKAKALGVDKPASWTRTLDETLPWFSMSAPNNIWRSGLSIFIGDGIASKVFGHKQSYAGYIFRPFTYTYQHVMDHLYNHPEPTFTGTRVFIPEPSNDVRGGTSSIPFEQPATLNEKPSSAPTIELTPAFKPEATLSAANTEEAPLPPSPAMTAESTDRLAEQNIDELEEGNIHDEF